MEQELQETKLKPWFYKIIKELIKFTNKNRKSPDCIIFRNNASKLKKEFLLHFLHNIPVIEITNLCIGKKDIDFIW